LRFFPDILMVTCRGRWSEKNKHCLVVFTKNLISRASERKEK